MHNAYIEIDKQQLVCNLKAISTWVNRDSATAANCSRIKVCLPVKANAYGHGLVDMAKLAEDFVDYFAVACIDEAIALKQHEIKKPILVFGAFSEEQIYDLVSNSLELTISSILEARMVIRICQNLGVCCKIHVKVDTGMNRIGVSYSHALELINYVHDSQDLELSGVYSHLANSDVQDDSFTYDQIKQFAEIANQVKLLNPNTICHLANSGGICYYPESYFNMVRPGIFSYGYWPKKILSNSVLSEVKPCFSLKSKVVYLKEVGPNTGISYNHKYITRSSTKIATISIGYGDGYRRLLSNCGEVLINGHKYAVAGTVCMDMLMVDIGLESNIALGDEVVLIGKQSQQEISLYSVADKCNTITYEVLCGFTSRLPRIYR